MGYERKKVLELSVCAGMWGLSFAESSLMRTIFLVPQFPYIVNGNVPVSWDSCETCDILCSLPLSRAQLTLRDCKQVTFISCIF